MEENGIFTEEQLKNMNQENLAKVILLMQKQEKKQKAQVEKQEKETARLQQKQQLLEEKVKELEFMNALLADRLSLEKRKRFGASSEKYVEGYEQMGLFNEAETQADLDIKEPEMEEVCPRAYKRKKRQGKKEEDLSKFPVTSTIKNELKGEELNCECGGKRKVYSTEITKTLKFIPAHFEVEEEITYIYSCSKCGEMVRALKGAPLLKGSVASASLVAGIMNAKYVNGMPLARQEREFKRYELNLSTKTMANWMILCSERYLKRLYDLMKEEFLSCRYIQCDETRIQVLDEPEQSASTQNWMWVYRTGCYSGYHQMVLFDYERTRGGYHPIEFLKGMGNCFLTCDGYQPYHRLPENITVTGCLAHARRRFEECLRILKKDFTKEQLKETTAYKAMARIALLYQIEDLAKELSPEERYLERQKQSKPVLDAFFEWLHELEPDVDRSSKIGDAILYTLNQEIYLRRYLEDGHLPIDNNDCERQLKNFAVGRRNWLFSKSIRGAQASAMIYSITETAMLNGLKPYHYLEHVLDKLRFIPEFENTEKVRALLPWSSDIPNSCKTPFQKS